MYEECGHIVITLNHIKTTIFMYNDFLSPSVPDGDEVRWGGALVKKNPTEAKTAHLMQIKAIFLLF